MSPPTNERTPGLGTGGAQDQQPAESITGDADSVDQALRRLGSYRHAAQAIRRSEGTLGQRGILMVELMQRARCEPDRWTRELAEQVVWAQSQWMFEGDAALRRNRIRGRLEGAARRLRLTGRETCPTCEQRLSDPSDWSFWAALRQAEVDRLLALEASEAA